MSLVIGLLRIIFGVAMLGLAGRVYLEHRLELSGTKNILVLDYHGYRLESDPQLLVLGIGIAGLIGALALCAGLYAVTHWPDREQDEDPPKPARPAVAPSDQAT